MRALRKTSAVVFVAALVVTFGAQAVAGPAPDEAAIRAHITFLADDLLEGRRAGTRGYDIAARYVAAQFAAAGLEPAGDAGTWLQQVPLIEGHRDSKAATLRLERKGDVREFKPLDEFVPGVDYVSEESSVSGELVFVGYGVSAPELGYDDFAKIDARGKIAVVLSGAPPAFKSHERAYYTSSLVKHTNLVRHGVIGLIQVSTPVDEKRVPWERLVEQTWNSGMRWLDASGKPVDAFPELEVQLYVSQAAARVLFEGAPRTLEQAFARAEASKPQAFALPGRVTMSRKTKLQRLKGANVVARLEGSDPKLREEAIVFTAHLDGLGRGKPVEGDDIYNGALDNASGVAVMLEVARAVASGPRPKRSMLFVAVTAEEKGLLGADYFAAHPPIPVDRLVANVNMDMPVATFPLADLVGYGAEHSTLGDITRRAVAAEGFTLTPDPWPEETIFVRSDQYPFVRRGVPAIYLDGGGASRDPAIDGGKAVDEFLKEHYHRPSDDLSRPIHYPTLAALARVNVHIGLEVANAPEAPHWNPGDFFAVRFGASRAAAPDAGAKSARP